MEPTPRIFTSPRTGRKGYSAFFAYELDSIRPIRELARKEVYALNSALVRALYRPELDAAFEIRAVRWSDRGPCLALRVRVSDADCVDASLKARTLHEILCGELETLFPHTCWKPVSTDERYRQLFSECGTAAVCDIRRKSGVQRLQCERAGLSELITPLSETGLLAEADLWTPSRIIFRPEPWDAAMSLLSAVRGPAVISSVIAPVRLEEREKQFLMAQAKAATSSVALDCLDDDPHGVEQARKASEQMLSEYSDAAFLWALRTAAEGKGVEFAEAVGALFCASAGFATPWEAEKGQASGGFKAAAIPQEDRAAAAADLENASFSLFSCAAPTPWHRLSLMASVNELAGLFSIPGAGTGRCPAVAATHSRTEPPTGRFAASGLLLGSARCSGREVPVRLGQSDLSRHTYFLGATGTGKTTVLRNFMTQVIHSGSGCMVIDFHDDLSGSLIAATPPSRRGDIIHINLADPASDFRLNVLDHDGPVERDLAINALMEIFQRIFIAESLGPIFELAMRTGLITLMSAPGAMLCGLPKIFIDRDYRRALTARCAATTPQLAEAWEYLERTTGDHSLSAMLPYVLSKINMFTHSSVIRPIISARKSSVDFEAAMRDRKIVLISLAKSRIGRTNASFVAMLLAETLLRAAMKRGPAGAAAPFYLCVDEFQNVAVPSFAEMASEIRKFGVSLILANQYISQTPAAVHTAIMNNAGTIACFRAGAEDAALLEPYFAPTFTASDLINLPVGKACAAVTACGKRLEPFSLFITPPAYDASAAEPQRKAPPPSYSPEVPLTGVKKERRYTVRVRKPRDGGSKGSLSV